MASTEEDNNKSNLKKDNIEPPKETNNQAPGSENFVVLDMAGDSEDSDKEGRDVKEKVPKIGTSDTEETKPTTSEATVKTISANPRLRKKPKAPVVDVNSLRKRKWQLKVYPLHADDLQLNYVSILCKLASESLLYIPSESRHGKAELYVATQKETAAIIGKLLRMGFHHKLLSIEVVRKDTGGKDDGDESKKECKAFLMFDKFLSKKIFDAKGEKGTLIEKIVTLNKLPKEATKDFIAAIFPFATDIKIIESDNPDERKAKVKCKTPVTSLLVYKSFKRLEINDVHVKLSVDDSVKAIALPPMFFIPPPEKKDLGPPESPMNLNNQGSLQSRRPLLTSLNRRAMMIKKKALLTRKRPTRGQVMRNHRMGMGPEDDMGDELPRPFDRPPLRRMGEGRWSHDMSKYRGPGGRDYQGGPGRRRLNEKMADRRNREHDPSDRTSRHRSQENQMTKEMLQLQNQLNQAIKNQIAMLHTSQGPSGIRSGSFSDRDPYMAQGASQRASLLGHPPPPPPPPRHFGSTGLGADGPRSLTQDASKVSLLGQGPRSFGGELGLGGSSRKRDPQLDYAEGPWPARMDRGERRDRGERSMARTDRMDRPVRPDRSLDRSAGGSDRIDRSTRIDRGDRERGVRNERTSAGAGDMSQSRSQRQPPYTDDSVRNKTDRGHATASSLPATHGSDTARSSSRRQGEYTGSRGGSHRNETYSGSQSSNSNRYGDYSNSGQNEGESGPYYRRY